MQYFQLVKFAQLDNFLRQRGYSPEFILFVLAKPKNLHKSIGKIINDNLNSNEDELRRLIDQLPANNLSQKPKKKTLDDKLLKIFEEDGASKSQMLLFFESIPVGYHTFVKRTLLAREIHPHDLATLQDNIKDYETLKKRNVAIDKNINNFATYATWINEMSRFSDFDPDAVKLKVDPRKLKGVTLDDSMNGYQIWKITDVESLKDIGLGTKWCTRRDYKPCQADNYLKRFGPLYVITKSGNLIAQFTADLFEIQDTKDVSFEVLPKGLNLDKYIIRTKNRINLASKQLKNDRDFVLEAVKQNYGALYYASEQLKNDREIVFEAVKQDGNALAYASEQLKNDREIVLEAVKQNGRALRYASEQLKNDRQIVLEAVKNNGFALAYASVQLKNDREIVFEAVKRHGLALAYAPEQLKNDREFVLEAVKEDGRALRDASEQFQNDREIVLEAVKQDGDALEYASEQLKNNRQIVIEAVKQNGFALHYASKQLKNDPEIRAIAYRKKSIASGWYQRIKF